MTRRTCLVVKRPASEVCVFVGVRPWKLASKLSPRSKLNLGENPDENSFSNQEGNNFISCRKKKIREISEAPKSK